VEESSRRRFARYVHVKNWNFLFYCSNIAKSEIAMLWRMLSRLEPCIVYSCIWSVTLTKSIVPRKTWRKLWHSYISKLFLTKMQVKSFYGTSAWWKSLNGVCTLIIFHYVRTQWNNVTCLHILILRGRKLPPLLYRNSWY
jgi:hypothetical protein